MIANYNCTLRDQQTNVIYGEPNWGKYQELEVLLHGFYIVIFAKSFSPKVLQKQSFWKSSISRPASTEI